MIKAIIYFVLLLISVSLVLAVTIDINPVDATGNQVIEAAIGDCQGASLVKFFNPDNDLIDIKQGKDNWVAAYNTNSDASDGKYKVTASCTNGKAEKNFCVDDNGCVPPVNVNPQDDNQGGSSSSSSSGSSGGGCVQRWTCGGWSVCNTSLQQSRTCTESRCNKAPKVEVQDCQLCTPSWICRSWSACAAGKKTRTCVDERACGTTANKPEEQQPCQAQQQQQQTQQQITQTQQQQSQQSSPKQQAPASIKEETLPAFSFKDIWEMHSFYIIIFSAAAVILLIFLFVIRAIIRHKRLVPSGVQELKKEEAVKAPLKLQPSLKPAPVSPAKPAPRPVPPKVPPPPHKVPSIVAQAAEKLKLPQAASGVEQRVARLKGMYARAQNVIFRIKEKLTYYTSLNRK